MLKVSFDAEQPGKHTDNMLAEQGSTFVDPQLDSFAGCPEQKHAVEPGQKTSWTVETVAWSLEMKEHCSHPSYLEDHGLDMLGWLHFLQVF